jgi:hypothetical protein
MTLFLRKKINLLSFAGDLCHFPLTSHIGGATEGGAARYGCRSYVIVGVGGQELIFPDL